MLDQGNVRRRVADRPSHRFKTSEPEQKIRACRCSRNLRILGSKKSRERKPWRGEGRLRNTYEERVANENFYFKLAFREHK